VDRNLEIPPRTRQELSSPEVLASSLSKLIGTDFPLSGKSRTDGSNLRKLVGTCFSSGTLPVASQDFSVVPPKKKGVPKILREYVDTYIITTGDKYNLQVWNRTPAGNGVQVVLENGEDALRESDVRFVLVRVDPVRERISTVLVLTPDYIETKFGKFGKPTVKQQLIISGSARERVLSRNPPILFHSDTSNVESLTVSSHHQPLRSIDAAPERGQVFAAEVLMAEVAEQLLGEVIEGQATKNRGQYLENLVAELLGYDVSGGSLVGGYPDIPNQILEVKVQDSPTVDLGRYSPQFLEELSGMPNVTTCDVRYLIVLTEENSGTIEGVILCPGERLGDYFTYVGDKSYKCQRSIPVSFFDNYEGQSVYNP
jgi:hypothetical protein